MNIFSIFSYYMHFIIFYKVSISGNSLYSQEFHVTVVYREKLLFRGISERTYVKLFQTNNGDKHPSRHVVQR